MRLCFLMERKYAPYPKWFGTAFRRLECADRFEPFLSRAIRGETWQEREAALSGAYAQLVEMQNALGIVPPKPAATAPFFNRPFQVIHLHTRFADLLAGEITDPYIRRIASRRLLGGIDHICDNTDLLTNTEYRLALRRLYD